jgi:CIC family chloride channel protein
MVTEPFTLNASLTTREVFKQLKGDIKYTGFPVMKHGNLVGMVSLSEIAKVHAQSKGKALIEDIMNRKIISIYPDQSLLVAFDKLKKYGIGRLPVVSRLNDKRLLGIITAEDIVNRFGYHIQEEVKSYKIEDIEEVSLEDD